MDARMGARMGAQKDVPVFVDFPLFNTCPKPDGRRVFLTLPLRVPDITGHPTIWIRHRHCFVNKTNPKSARTYEETGGCISPLLSAEDVGFGAGIYIIGMRTRAGNPQSPKHRLTDAACESTQR